MLKAHIILGVVMIDFSRDPWWVTPVCYLIVIAAVGLWALGLWKLIEIVFL